MYLVGEIFVSEVIGREVFDREGETVGKLTDLIVRIDEIFPHVTGLVINIRSGKNAVLSFDNIELFNKNTITANIYKKEIRESEPSENQIAISRDILDKQIVDIDGVKVVRVNDIKLGDVKGNLCLIAADVGFNAIFRRLGLSGIAKGLVKRKGGGRTQNLIAWNYLQPVDPKVTNLTLKVAKSKLSELHPSDIASIMSQIPPKERAALFDSLELDTAAEALHELEPDAQISIIHNMDKEQASDLLEKMPPDEAADLLGDLPEETAQELLNLMEDDEAEDVQELLEHDDDTAGGLMTTDFLYFPPSMTVFETFKNLRLMAPDVEMIYYIYVTDDEDKLLGVLSIKDLLLANDSTRIDAIMNSQIKSVLPDTDEEEVAEMISKYNFYAIPVVDGENVILGIITVDDIVDLVIPPPSRRKKLRV